MNARQIEPFKDQCRQLGTKFRFHSNLRSTKLPTTRNLLRTFYCYDLREEIRETYPCDLHQLAVLGGGQIGERVLRQEAEDGPLAVEGVPREEDDHDAKESRHHEEEDGVLDGGEDEGARDEPDDEQGDERVQDDAREVFREGVLMGVVEAVDGERVPARAPALPNLDRAPACS
jgi:hypothetical protein